MDGIVIHYTANPGSTAMQNRDYFENLPETQEAQASSHFVVGIEGEVVQCIPTSEWSYASNQRNFDTISIECCHPDDSGEFTDETYNSVVQLAGFLCKRFNLTSDDVIRHYDVTEKLCPLYYVEHEDAWIQMKADIQAYADSTFLRAVFKKNEKIPVGKISFRRNDFSNGDFSVIQYF